MFSSCSSPSDEDFREKGHSINKSIIKELKAIHTRDDLVKKELKLQRLFERLAETMIAARNHQLDMHRTSIFLPFSKEDEQLSGLLRAELNRVYRLPGGKELVERSQQKALDRLNRSHKPETPSEVKRLK